MDEDGYVSTDYESTGPPFVAGLCACSRKTLDHPVHSLRGAAGGLLDLIPGGSLLCDEPTRLVGARRMFSLRAHLGGASRSRRIVAMMASRSACSICSGDFCGGGGSCGFGLFGTSAALAKGHSNTSSRFAR